MNWSVQTTENDILHYGVLGMRWGIRRYQPYSVKPRKSGKNGIEKGKAKKVRMGGAKIIKALAGMERDEAFTEERIIPKGLTVFRATTNKDAEKGSVYVSYLTPEKYLYSGNWSRYQLGEEGKRPVYEKTLKTTEDLKIPSRKHVVDVMADVLLNDPRLKKISINQSAETALNFRYILDDKQFKEKLSKMDIKESWKEYMLGLGTNPKLKEKIIDRLKKEGYNAMTDEAGVGGGKGIDFEYAIEGIDPLIIFDSKKTLNPVKSKQLTKRKMAWNQKNFQMWKQNQ